MPSRLILASTSSRRLSLLSQVGIVPNSVVAPNVDETPLAGEQPRQLATRLAAAKGAHVAAIYRDAVVLAADTVVACGHRILDKVEKSVDAEAHLRLLSGRRHRVYGGVAVINPGELVRSRLVITQVSFKRLHKRDIDDYLETGEWQGKAGGYAIQGLAGGFVKRINGSYSNVVGLPLYETLALLRGVGAL